jgi:adenylate cyclase
MEKTPLIRRLAAIVIADVVGYTRLMERDEAGTHSRLREIRDEVTDPKIAEHGGRIVWTAGDGILVEFPSSTAALLCAVEVQREMGHRNLYAAPDTKIEFRVGINLGDILIDGDNIAGDGVNVAARLETLAEPGGICIGSTVYEQIHEDLGFSFVDIGEQQVKNIARPIHAYRVMLGASVVPQLGIKAVLRGSRSAWTIGVIGLLVVSALATLIVRGWSGQSATARFETAASAEPAHPMSIAVLPFTVMGGNSPDEQLSESLTQDVTRALGRSARNAWVVSYGLVSGYKGNAIDARKVGHALNVRYLAEGEIRRVDGKLVLNAMLIDTENATQVWNDRIDIPDSQIDTGHDVIVAQLAKRLRLALTDVETHRAAHQSPARANAIELSLLGSAALDRQSLAGAREARTLYDEALRLDPGFAWALIGQAWSIDSLLDFDPHADRDLLVQEMDDFSLRAVAADRNDPRVWIARADALIRQYRWPEAQEALAEVLRIDPDRSDVYHTLAWISIWNGQPEEALTQLDRAITLDPRETDDGELLSIRCRAHLSLGQYDEAIRACQRGVALDNWWVTYMFLTAAYAHQGEMAKALAAKDQVLKHQPGLTIARLKAIRVSDNPIFWKQTEAYVFAGLRQAGIPEQ